MTSRQQRLVQEIDARRAALNGRIRARAEGNRSIRFSDLHREIGALLRVAGAEARETVAAVRDVVHLWELGQTGARELEAVSDAGSQQVRTDGVGIYVDDECLLTRVTASEGGRAPVAVNAKAFHRASLEWIVRDEAERLLAEQEQRTVRVRGPVSMSGVVTAARLETGWCAMQLLEEIDYDERAAEFAEMFVFGRTGYREQHGLLTSVGFYIIASGWSTILVAWDPHCEDLYRDRHDGQAPIAAHLRAWISAKRYRRGTHEQRLRDALRPALSHWGVELVDQPSGIAPVYIARAIRESAPRDAIPPSVNWGRAAPGTESGE